MISALALARSLFDPFSLTSHGCCPLQEPWPPMPQALALLPWPALRWAAEASAPPPRGAGAGEACHRASFIGAPVPLQTLAAQGRITGVSDRWLELMGYDRAEEVVGHHIGEVEEPASAARIAAAW